MNTAKNLQPAAEGQNVALSQPRATNVTSPSVDEAAGAEADGFIATAGYSDVEVGIQQQMQVLKDVNIQVDDTCLIHNIFHLLADEAEEVNELKEIRCRVISCRPPLTSPKCQNKVQQRSLLRMFKVLDRFLFNH